MPVYLCKCISLIMPVVPAGAEEQPDTAVYRLLEIDPETEFGAAQCP